LSDDISATNQGSNNRNYEQEIASLRLEVEGITRELADARKVASEKSRDAARARRLLLKRNKKQARGARTSVANVNSDTYKKWFRRQVDNVSNFLSTTFGQSIVEMPKSDIDGSVINSDSYDGVFNITFLGKLLVALTSKHEDLESCFLDALAEQRGVN
jgi:hypothetical protein